MRNLQKRGLCLIFALCLFIAGTGACVAADTSPTVFIMGDSTAANYYYDSNSLRTGWGQVLHNFFQDADMVVNCAKSGASAHSFYDDPYLWDSMKARISSGDYVLIQFGHNDGSDSITDYKNYLSEFITYVNSKDAYPVLVTSVERRLHAAYSNESNSSLYPYVTAMEELSASFALEGIEVPVIDVWRGVRAAINDMDNDGDDSTNSIDWYVDSVDGDEASDNTHLVRLGAMEVARIFAQKLQDSSSTVAAELAEYLVADVEGAVDNGDPAPNLNEDFENYNYADVNLGVPWYLNGTATEDKDAKIWSETEGGNNALQFTMGNTSGICQLKYRFYDAVTDGYYKLKYRVRSNASSTKRFCAFIGSYTASMNFSTSQVNGKNVSTTSSLTDVSELENDVWYDLEFYIDVTNKKLNIMFEGYQIDSRANIALGTFSSIGFGFESTTSSAGSNAAVAVDDIWFGEIDTAEYNNAVGILYDGMLAKEDFSKGKNGATIGTTFWGWVNTSSVSGSTMTYATDPTDSDNLVAKLQSSLNKINKNHTLTYTLGETLTDGIYSVKFRLRTADDDSNTIWLSVLNGDKTQRHFIGFSIGGDYVTFYTTKDGANYSPRYEYNFDLNIWYNIEVIYDLNSEDETKVTIKIEDTTVVENVTIGGATSYKNDGTISSFHFQLPSDASATTASSEPEDGIYASFLIDDIEIRNRPTNIIGVTESGGQITSITAYVGSVPTASQKFIVAAYETDESGFAELKGVSYAEASEVGTQEITLSEAVSLESGYVIKVYFWDLSTLTPLSSVFTTSE